MEHAGFSMHTEIVKLTDRRTIAVYSSDSRTVLDHNALLRTLEQPTRRVKQSPAFQRDHGPSG